MFLFKYAHSLIDQLTIIPGELVDLEVLCHKGMFLLSSYVISNITHVTVGKICMGVDRSTCLALVTCFMHLWRK